MRHDHDFAEHVEVTWLEMAFLTVLVYILAGWDWMRGNIGKSLACALLVGFAGYFGWHVYCAVHTGAWSR